VCSARWRRKLRPLGWPKSRAVASAVLLRLCPLERGMATSNSHWAALLIFWIFSLRKCFVSFRVAGSVEFFTAWLDSGIHLQSLTETLSCNIKSVCCDLLKGCRNCFAFLFFIFKCISIFFCIGGCWQLACACVFILKMLEQSPELKESCRLKAFPRVWVRNHAQAFFPFSLNLLSLLFLFLFSLLLDPQPDLYHPMKKGWF